MAEASQNLRLAQLAILDGEVGARQSILEGLAQQLPSSTAARDLARAEERLAREQAASDASGGFLGMNL
jgi:hypothetical protein